jgi:hypothetical protein
LKKWIIAVVILSVVLALSLGLNIFLAYNMPGSWQAKEVATEPSNS